MGEKLTGDSSWTEQVYQGDKARAYEFLDTECDRNVYTWIRNQLSRAVSGAVVLDAGCGGGELLKFSKEHGAAKLIGIDASKEMLDKVAISQGQVIVPWGADADSVKHVLDKNDAVIIHGKLETVLGQGLVAADVAISSFNVVCFADPNTPIDSIYSALRPGGKLILLTNTFFPRDFNIDTASVDSPTTIDLDSYRGQVSPLPSGTVFRQVLHLGTKDGPPNDLPLQDYAHSISDLARAFPEEKWKTESAVVFPPQGCSLVVSPDDPNLRLFDQYGGTPPSLLDPKLHLKYLKMCAVIEKVD